MCCWPLEVYDYEKKAITDEAVGGIDLHAGAWIHCKWYALQVKKDPSFKAPYKTQHLIHVSMLL